MKLLTILLAAMACQSAAAAILSPDSLNTADENRMFAVEFVRDAQQLKCNAAGREGAEKAVYEIYRDLFDEGMLIERKILRTPHSGRYVTPQTTIDYGVLPPDSTLNTVQVLLETVADPFYFSNPLPEKLGRLLDSLVPFRLEEQKAFRKTICHRIDPFYPQTIYAPDSVICITKELLKRLEEFSKRGMQAGRDIGRVRNEFLTAEFSAKSTGWVSYVHWIDRPLWISAILFEDGLQRAFVNVLAGGGKGWGVLVERDADDRWQIVAAQMLYSAQ